MTEQERGRTSQEMVVTCLQCDFHSEHDQELIEHAKEKGHLSGRVTEDELEEMQPSPDLTPAITVVMYGAGALTGALAVDTLGYLITAILAMGIMLIGAYLIWRKNNAE